MNRARSKVVLESPRLGRSQAELGDQLLLPARCGREAARRRRMDERRKMMRVGVVHVFRRVMYQVPPDVENILTIEFTVNIIVLWVEAKFKHARATP